MSEQQRQPDIFDKLVHLKIFRWFEPFFQKNREMLMHNLFWLIYIMLEMLLQKIRKKL